jgi:AcrR family transcriptional regulator
MGVANVGRPSLVAERRQQILAAFSRCIAERGLEGTTLDAIAAQAGVQRAAIRHYVGNRDQLIRAGVEHIAAQYARSLEIDLECASSDDRLVAVLDALFLGRFATGHFREDRAVDAMIAAAASDERVRERLREMYARFEEALTREIAAAHPDAAPERVVGIAYAILCLVEQNNAMRFLGLPPERTHAARSAAGDLVETLRV